MLGRVVLKVFPKMVGQCVLFWDFLVQDGCEFWAFTWKSRDLKGARRLETNKKNALAMLGHNTFCVNNGTDHDVTEVFSQCVVNDFEGAPPIVPSKVLYIFQHEGNRLVVFNNIGNGEEKIALLNIIEAMFAAETVLLGNTGEAERLAGKSSAKNVEFRNVGHGHGMNVTVRFLTEIGFVSYLGVLVPIARENAVATGLLERDAKSSDTAKKVNEF
jgi:hypothetical protein